MTRIAFPIAAVIAALACSHAPAAVQEVTLEPIDSNGALVPDAVCNLVNQHGSWRVNAPGSVSITASRDWLAVKCVKGLDFSGSITAFDTARSAASRRAPASGSLPQLDGNPSATILRVPMLNTNAPARTSPNRSEVQVARVTRSTEMLKSAPTATLEPVIVAAAPAFSPAPASAPAPAPAPEQVITAAPVLPAKTRTLFVNNPPADFYDVNAVPFLNAQGRSVYADFRNFPLPRAFAIAKNGEWGWAVHVADASGMAIQNCERRAASPCEIYAVDKKVVWPATIQ